MLDESRDLGDSIAAQCEAEKKCWSNVYASLHRYIRTLNPSQEAEYTRFSREFDSEIKEHNRRLNELGGFPADAEPDEVREYGARAAAIFERYFEALRRLNKDTAALLSEVSG